MRCRGYPLGRFAAGFLDDTDLSALNERPPVGSLVMGRKRQLFLVYDVLTEGMTQRVFNDTLDLFKRVMDPQTGRLLS